MSPSSINTPGVFLPKLCVQWKRMTISHRGGQFFGQWNMSSCATLLETPNKFSRSTGRRRGLREGGGSGGGRRRAGQGAARWWALLAPRRRWPFSLVPLVLPVTHLPSVFTVPTPSFEVCIPRLALGPFLLTNQQRITLSVSFKMLFGWGLLQWSSG